MLSDGPDQESVSVTRTVVTTSVSQSTGERNSQQPPRTTKSTPTAPTASTTNDDIGTSAARLRGRPQRFGVPRHLDHTESSESLTKSTLEPSNSGVATVVPQGEQRPRFSVPKRPSSPLSNNGEESQDTFGPKEALVEQEEEQSLKRPRFSVPKRPKSPLREDESLDLFGQEEEVRSSRTGLPRRRKIPQTLPSPVFVPARVTEPPGLLLIEEVTTRKAVFERPEPVFTPSQPRELQAAKLADDESKHPEDTVVQNTSLLDLLSKSSGKKGKRPSSSTAVRPEPKVSPPPAVPSSQMSPLENLFSIASHNEPVTVVTPSPQAGV